MKFIYKNAGDYVFRGQHLKQGDVVEFNDDVTVSFSRLFKKEKIEKKEPVKSKFKIDVNTSKEDLLKLAEMYNIVVKANAKRKDIINKLNEELPNE